MELKGSSLLSWPFLSHRTIAEIDDDTALAEETIGLTPQLVPTDELSRRVLALARTYPDWGATRIAEVIGRNDAYVRTVARLNRLSLPRSPYGAHQSAGRDYMRKKRRKRLDRGN
ncbi:hypothetical protein FPZ24_04855 [Sphingomonas panacisoli]|uniref:Uncharacterized protein n=1 Tax=Sphingomonas panacisoli TaxID=1813879 RepID=A0A5B8LG51_9SPHN|nr:hypothetical protein [Sphingomonas panacisoli]QDZ06889.1 hypothetical protein FPZ24_04855 [Sphingomonas panacisoli]